MPKADRCQIVFRKGALTVFSLAGSLAVTAIFVVVAFKVPRPGLFGGALIFVGCTYGVWLIGWHSAVRIYPEGVIVDNVLVRHVIPWGELAKIDAQAGLEFRLRDGTVVGSIMYGGSLLGAMLGYRYTRGVAARMQEARKRMQESVPDRSMAVGYRSGFHASPWPPLVILAIMEAIAAITFLSK
jgi:hypothetical protein